MTRAASSVALAPDGPGYGAALARVAVGDVAGLARELSQIRLNPSALERLAVLAAGNGQLGVLKLLEEHGADTRACARDALEAAAGTGRIEIVRHLHARGAEPKKHGPALVTAAARYGHLETLRYLAQAGCDLAPCAALAD